MFCYTYGQNKSRTFGGRPPTHFEFDGAKVLLLFDICKLFVHFLTILHHFLKNSAILGIKSEGGTGTKPVPPSLPMIKYTPAFTQRSGVLFRLLQRQRLLLVVFLFLCHDFSVCSEALLFWLLCPFGSLFSIIPANPCFRFTFEVRRR